LKSFLLNINKEIYINKINMKENMQKRFVKEKAFLMIFLIITLSFTVANFEEVSADEGNVCCEYTSSGDTCVYTDEDNCNGGNAVSTTCEQTSYCETGVCVSSEGKCSDGVSKTTCESLGYQWNEGSSDDYAVCQKECCVIAESQCSYTTEDHCSYLIEDLEDIELDWRDVDSEAACSNICRETDKGCCVESDVCSYTTYGLCADADIDLNTGTGFYEGEYCADLGACACVSHDTKRCIDEDVYWFDSCGNQEDVAEDCDYLSSTWCGYDEDEDDYVCESIDCEETFDGVYNIEGVETQRNPHDERIGGDREHGESWCLYESPAGGYKDRPGSQHYRSYCYFGEEIIEPCSDYREEVCIQSPYDAGFELDTDYNLWKAASISNDYDGPSGSACVNLVDNYLLSQEVATVSVGGSFWADTYGTDVCSVANVDCGMTYARDSRSDSYFQAGLGVMCTSPQWTKTLSDYCMSVGDCGVSSNIAGEYSSSGFYMGASQSVLAREEGDHSSKKVYVGYDECVDHFFDGGKYGNPFKTDENKIASQVEEVNSGEQEAVFCLYECSEKTGGSESCDFINTIEKDEFYDYYSSGEADYYYRSNALSEDEEIILGNGFPELTFAKDLGEDSYGVYGGLIGVSQMQEDNELGTIKTNLGWTIAFGTISAAGGAAAAAYLEVMKLAGREYTTYAAAQVAAKEAGKVASKEIIDAAGEKAYEAAVQAAAKKASEQEIQGVLSAAATARTASSAAVVIGGVITIVMEAIGWIEIYTIESPIERMEKSQTFAISSGIAAGMTAVSMYIAVATTGLGPAGWIVGAVALVVAGVSAILSSGGETRDVTISSFCEAWQAPTGGDYCELCDVSVSEGGLAIDDGEGNILRGWDCTEYKCKSLGQGCEYIEENVGSERAKCISVAVNDVNHPIIEDAYLLGNYKDLDVEFVEDDYLKVKDKVAPYTFFEFGIELDEVSQCKIEYESLHETYEEMDLYFPDSYFDYNHNQSWILTPNEVYNFYVRCQDHNGNNNIDAFVIQVETTGGDDITPPTIDATSVNNGAFIANGVNETIVSLFVDEPANCKWSFSDADYSLMEYYMSCSGIPETASSLFENECSALLNVSYGNNYYYFACEDAAGNANTENYAFTLVGTDSLNLDYASPNGTIYYDYTTISAGTSGGAYGDGKAVCSYGGIEFFETNSSVHTQNLEDLDAGDYNYGIVCSDIAGNTNSTDISFTIAVDSDAPMLSGLYLIDTILYYELDEDATCEYYFEEFDYGEGTSVAGSFTLTELSTYYLICEDVFGNQGEYVLNV